MPILFDLPIRTISKPPLPAQCTGSAKAKDTPSRTAASGHQTACTYQWKHRCRRKCKQETTSDLCALELQPHAFLGAPLLPAIPGEVSESPGSGVRPKTKEAWLPAKSCGMATSGSRSFEASSNIL